MKRRHIAPNGGWQTGVYVIVNTVNGKIYVGSAARSFNHRFGQHRGALRYCKHHTSHLQAAWNKYGEAAFQFVVLERCQPDFCMEREQHWIEFLHATDPQCGYNSGPAMGSRLGTVNTPATLAKLRAFWRNARVNPSRVSERFAQRFHLMSSDPVYGIWHTLVQRQRASFCERWLSFQNFYNDVGPRPSPSHVMSRWNASGLYEPSNCGWTTRLETAGQSPRAKLITWRERTQHIAAWARELGKSRLVLAHRLRVGWSVDKAFTEPVKSRSY